MRMPSGSSLPRDHLSDDGAGLDARTLQFVKQAVQSLPGDTDEEAAGSLRVHQQQPLVLVQVSPLHNVVDGGKIAVECRLALCRTPAASHAPLSTGTAPKFTRAPTPLPWQMALRWPSSPNPVTSAQALAPAAVIASAAARLSVGQSRGSRWPGRRLAHAAACRRW